MLIYNQLICLAVNSSLFCSVLQNGSCPIYVVLNEPSSYYLEDEFAIIHNKTDPELLVFLNYRFGPFGFLDLGHELTDAPFNVGLSGKLDCFY